MTFSPQLISFLVGFLSLGSETIWVRTYAFANQSTAQALAGKPVLVRQRLQRGLVDRLQAGRRSGRRTRAVRVRTARGAGQGQ